MQASSSGNYIAKEALKNSFVQQSHSDLKEESRKYYREKYNEASNKLGQVQREYNMAEREILQFKRTASFE